MTKRTKWYLALLATVALLAAACDSGDSDDTSEPDAVEADGTETEAEGSGAASGDTASDEAPAESGDDATDDDAMADEADGSESDEAATGGGDECLVGRWRALPGSVGSAYDQIMSQAQAEGNLPDIESEITGTQQVEIRSDGTLSSKGEVQMVITVPGQPEINGGGTVDTEATWSTDGDQLSISTTEIISDLVLSMEGLTIPLGDAGTPNVEVETTVSTFSCDGDRLSIDVSESGLQFSSELERIG